MQPDDAGTTTDRPPVVEHRPEVVLDDDPAEIPAQPSPPSVVTHVTRLDEQGPFVVATCACGWRSYARRSRPLARAEARDHELLHAG
jgi:hypothetical protein